MIKQSVTFQLLSALPDTRNDTEDWTIRILPSSQPLAAAEFFTAQVQMLQANVSRAP